MPQNTDFSPTSINSFILYRDRIVYQAGYS